MGVLGRCDLSGLADLFIKASIPNLQKIYLCLEDWDQLDQTEAKKILRNSAFSAFDARGALCIRFLQGVSDLDLDSTLLISAVLG
jgi:hypothetical protein